MNKLGLIAGGGIFPVLIAEEAKKNGYEVYTAALKGAADEKLKNISKEIVFFKLGQITATIKFFKSRDVKNAAIAGIVKHSSIFDVMPDMRAVKILASIKNTKAQTILDAVSLEFEKNGIKFANISQLLKNHLAGVGILTKAKPNANQLKNVKLAWKAAKTIANLDIGLTAVASGGAVIALEAMEGTDECILRAGQIYGIACSKAKKKPGLIVAKVARSNQDMRFDLPVIGTKTVFSMIKAGAKVLALQAGKTLILDKKETIKLANRHKIAILGSIDN
jgi:DUF1009 family protein